MLLMKLWQVMMTQKNLIINTKVFKEIFNTKVFKEIFKYFCIIFKDLK